MISRDLALLVKVAEKCLKNSLQYIILFDNSYIRNSPDLYYLNPKNCCYDREVNQLYVYQDKVQDYLPGRPKYRQDQHHREVHSREVQ